MTEALEDALKLEYLGSNPKILKAIADANQLLEDARFIENKRQAAGHTRNSVAVRMLEEALMDARWNALCAVSYARKLIEQEGR